MECNSNPLLAEFPTSSETVKAIKLLSSSKAPGSDAIPAEIYKTGGLPVAEKLIVISHYVEKRSHPEEFKDASIIQFKWKGNPKFCENYGGITLLSIAGRIPETNLNEHPEQSGLQPENQCGFRKDRGRQLQEKCQEQNVDLYIILCRPNQSI